MVQITATREIKYAGKRVLPGQTFDATEKDAKIFIAVKRATLIDAAIEPPAGLKSMSAPPPAPEPVAESPEPVEEEAAPEAPAHPQTYSRRDMTAEPVAGPTGQGRLSPSSRRDHPRRAKT